MRAPRPVLTATERRLARLERKMAANHASIDALTFSAHTGLKPYHHLSIAPIFKFVLWLIGDAVLCLIRFFGALPDLLVSLFISVGLHILFKSILYYTLNRGLKPILTIVFDVINVVIMAINTLKPHKIHHMHVETALGPAFSAMLNMRSVCGPTDSMLGVISLIYFEFTVGEMCHIMRYLQYIPIASWIPYLVYLGNKNLYAFDGENCNAARGGVCIAYSSDRLFMSFVYYRVVSIVVISFRREIVLIFKAVLTLLSIIVHLVRDFWTHRHIPTSDHLQRAFTAHLRHMIRNTV
jgi:hypothetical protein